MDLYYHWNFREGKIFPLPFYAPVFHTSEVTQCLNSFADGSLLLRIREYRPDSLIQTGCWVLPKLSIIDGASPGRVILSSSEIFFLIACVVSEYPNATATSLPTNHGSPEISTVLRLPNCGWVNTIGTSVGASASERWGTHLPPHYYVLSSNDVHLWHSLIRHEGRMGNNQLCKILLTLFEHISQKSISVSRGTLSQLCQKNKFSGCILNQTYYFACNITFI